MQYQGNTDFIFELVRKTKTLEGFSMRWYLFFVRTVSVLWLIFGPITLFSTMSQEVYTIYNGSYSEYFNNALIGPFNTIVFALFWIGEILLLSGRSEIKEFRRRGFQSIVAVSVISLASYAYTFLTYYQFGAESVLGSIIFPVILHTANIIYFVKRKSLFNR